MAYYSSRRLLSADSSESEVMIDDLLHRLDSSQPGRLVNVDEI